MVVICSVNSLLLFSVYLSVHHHGSNFQVHKFGNSFRVDPWLVEPSGQAAIMDKCLVWCLKALVGTLAEHLNSESVECGPGRTRKGNNGRDDDFVPLLILLWDV